MPGVLYEERLEENRRNRAVAGSGVGVCIGCFAGVGYGRTVGFGRRVSADTVIPSTSQLFVQNGRISGAFCGATIGFGAGSFLGSGLYMRKKIRLPAPLDNGGTYFVLPKIPNIPKKLSSAIRKTPRAVEKALGNYPKQLMRFGGRLLRIRGR